MITLLHNFEKGSKIEVIPGTMYNFLVGRTFVILEIVNKKPLEYKVKEMKSGIIRNILAIACKEQGKEYTPFSDKKLAIQNYIKKYKKAPKL